MPAENDSPSSSRALVMLAPPAQQEGLHRPIQRATSFVAQLIANVSGVPQTREKRRAEPSEVIAAYRATVERLRMLNEKSY